MHESALKACEIFLKTYFPNKKRNLKQNVLDIGALNVNGSLKDTILNHKLNYTGIDVVEGKGVDVVMKDPYKIPFPDNYFDASFCSSVFEHTDFFWILLLEIARVTKPSGLIYVNAPSNGFFHQHPVDSYRFYPDSGLSLTRWLNFNNFNSFLLESFLNKKTKHGNDKVWTDFVMVFLKDKNYKKNYRNRAYKLIKKSAYIIENEKSLQKKNINIFDYHQNEILNKKFQEIEKELNKIKNSFIYKIIKFLIK